MAALISLHFWLREYTCNTTGMQQGLSNFYFPLKIINMKHSLYQYAHQYSPAYRILTVLHKETFAASIKSAKGIMYISKQDTIFIFSWIRFKTFMTKRKYLWIKFLSENIKSFIKFKNIKVNDLAFLLWESSKYWKLLDLVRIKIP